jgi:hypothetical protein
MLVIPDIGTSLAQGVYEQAAERGVRHRQIEWPLAETERL